MKNFVLSIFFLLSNSFSFAQIVSIKVANLNTDKAVLLSLTGEKVSILDSLTAVVDGNFQFSLYKKHSGFYRLLFKNKSWIDFIYDNEDVEIETDANNISDSLRILKSESDKIYYEFARRNKDYKTKTELLQLILARYPKEYEYYQNTKEKLIQVQEDYLNFINITMQENPNSFVARYVRSAQMSVVDVGIPFNEQLTYLKTHALDNVNFYDDGLIYSDAFTNKTIEYLTYYRNPQLPLELLEKEFMAAVDSILNKAKVNEIVYQHIAEYLIDGFKKFGFDKIIDYIVENYVIKDNLCLDEKLESSIERRIDQARNFKIGSIVSNIVITDSSGRHIELNKITTEQTLILFYSSWCPHCIELIPKINQLYKNQNNINTEVFAVSVDTAKSDWIQFIEVNNLDWINVSDLNGWSGKAANDYYLYATPTMFLIDKQLKLIAKPSSIEELYKWF